MAMTPVPTQASPFARPGQNWPGGSLFYGIDNLSVLQGINSNTVDLIVMDPPFKNNGEVYHGSGTAAAAAFHDYWTWRDDVHETWWENIRGNWRGVHAVVDAVRYAVNSDMAAYVAAMAARFMECRRILRNTGSIYVHCDPDVSPYYRMLLDAVFGDENFRNEIVWKRSSAHNGSKNAASRHGAIHDVILYYTKTNDFVLNPIYTEYDPEYVRKFYRYTEEGTGRRYRLDNRHNQIARLKRTPDMKSWASSILGVTAKKTWMNS